MGRAAAAAASGGDDPAAIRKRIEAARRRKYALFDGKPKQTQRKHTLFSDATPESDQKNSRMEHNAALGDESAINRQKLHAQREPLIDGVPASMYADDQPKDKLDRRQILKEYLDANADFQLDVNRGAEDDIDLGGLPPHRYHNQSKVLEIPEESPLNQNVLSKNKLLDKSRHQKSTWGLTGREDGNVLDSVSTKTSTRDSGVIAAGTAERIAKQTGQNLSESEPPIAPRDGGYVHAFPKDANLEHQEEYVQYSMSIYTRRKLYLDGLTGYHDHPERGTRPVQRAVDPAPAHECGVSAGGVPL